MSEKSNVRVNRDAVGSKPFTLTLPVAAVDDLNYLCTAMGGLKKSQVIAYALSVLAARERKEREVKNNGQDD